LGGKRQHCGGKKRVASKNILTYLLIIVLAVVLLGGSQFNIDLEDFNPFKTTAKDNLVPVNKVIDFALTDQYAGSALATKTLVVYDSDGATQLESLTTGADGTITTAFTYPSDKVIYVYYESSNDKQWFKVTVPKMNPADAESATVNAIALKSFAVGTYTASTFKFGGTAITDGGTYNKTASGNSQTFTYSIANTGNDNTGVVASYDPIYAMNFYPVMYVTFSNTNYETVLVYGFDTDYTLGTTHYVANVLNDYSLTKHKVGNYYRSAGTLDVTFSLDLTGYSGDACVMQIYLYLYSDPAYAMSHGGAYGTEAVQADEITVTLQD